MRGQRSAKFAEYIATYAILKRIGVHEIALIEKRDASLGYGVFVREACDPGTSLIVVPSSRACSVTTMEILGANVRLMDCGDHKQVHTLENGVVSSLLGCRADQWVNLAWRLAIERQRSLSPWWGWLNMLPDSRAFNTMQEDCERKCRLHHTPLLPYLRDARSSIEQEVITAHAILAERNLMPSLNCLRWAVDVILSRAQHLPLCWTTATGDPVELGIIPFVDLINGDGEADRKRNARVEVASAVDELPDWYRAWFLHESDLRGADGVKELQHLMNEHFFAVVVLERGMAATEEVILEYELLPWVAGTPVKKEKETEMGDPLLLLGRLLRYSF